MAEEYNIVFTILMNKYMWLSLIQEYESQHQKKLYLTIEKCEHNSWINTFSINVTVSGWYM